jgi:hypothetical protein
MGKAMASFSYGDLTLRQKIHIALWYFIIIFLMKEL